MDEAYLTLNQAADYLGVSEDTIRRYVDRGELPTYKLDRTLRFRFEDLDQLVTKSFEVLLTPGLRAAISHSVQAQKGRDLWRVIICFNNTRGETRLVVPFGSKVKHTEYYVWVTEEYLEDHARLPGNIYGAEKFALRYIKQRFEATKDENGDRDIEKIEEIGVICVNGKCNRFFSLPPPLPPNSGSGKDR